MDLYNEVSQASAQYLTRRYSTSFGLATKLLEKSIRPHIYNIYGLVRLADEVVDVYGAKDAAQLLDTLESEVYDAIRRGYSSNMIVHAFAMTARQYQIAEPLIAPFFASMRMDAPGSIYAPEKYAAYIHGSAEVVGLMCLRVFCGGDNKQYERLQPGAAALGSAFQKVNFLRDLAEDNNALGRYYFPKGSFATFDEAIKREIITDIEHDFATARPAIQALPSGVRLAVACAANIYMELLHQLTATSAAAIRQHRVRVSNGKKLLIIAKTLAMGGSHV